MSEEGEEPQASEAPAQEENLPEVEPDQSEEVAEPDEEEIEPEEPPGLEVAELPQFQEEEIEIEETLPPGMIQESEEEEPVKEEKKKGSKKKVTGPYKDLVDEWENPEPLEKPKKGKGAKGKNMGLLGAFRVKAEDDKEDLGDRKNELSKSQKTKERDIKREEAPDKSMRKRKEMDSRFFDRYSIFPTKKWRGGTKNEYVLRFRNGRCYPADSALENHYGQITEHLSGKGSIKKVIYVPPKKHDVQNVEWEKRLLIQFSTDVIYYRETFHNELNIKKHGVPGMWNIFLEQKRGDHLIASQHGRIKYINYRNVKKVFVSTIKVEKKKVLPGSKAKKQGTKKFVDVVTAVGFNRHKIGSKTLDYIILGTSGLELYYVEIKLDKRGESCKSSFEMKKIRTLRKDPSAPRNNSVTSIVVEEEAYKDYIFVMVSTHFELYMFRGKRISQTEPFRFISFSSLSPIEHKHRGYNASPLRVYYRYDIVKEDAAGLDRISKGGSTKKGKSTRGMTKKQKKKRKQEEEEAVDVVKETFFVPHSFVQLTTQGLLHGKFSFPKVDEDETAAMKKRAKLFSTPSRKNSINEDYDDDGMENGKTGVSEDGDEENKFIGSSEDPIPFLNRGNLFLRDFEHLTFSEDKEVDWLKSSENKPIDVACTKYHILLFRKDAKRNTDLTILHYPPDLCQSLYGTESIRNDMISFKRTFNEPYDDDYIGFSTSPYDESNVIMYGKYAIKTLCPFQEQRHMYPVYFERARRWKEIKKFYEERRISYEEAQIQYELCRKYFLQLVVSIYSNQDKREELVILELAHFCMSCGWLEDAAIYFSLTKISVEEVMELFLEIDQGKHLRTYLMYKYKYKSLRMDHPISRKFSAVGYHQFKVQCNEEPDNRPKSLSLIQIHTTIVELYLQELNDMIRELEVSVKTESIEKKITNLKMELLNWLTKNLKVKYNCNVNLIYQLMTSYGHFDIAFQFVLKQRTFEEVLTLWLEGKRGTDPNFDIFKHVVDRMDGDEKNLRILLKFARHLFIKAPTRTSESLGLKPKLGPSLVNFLPSLTNYGEYISNEFDLSNPKYLCKRAQHRLLDLNEDGLSSDQIANYTKGTKFFTLRDSDVDRILNFYHSFDREQMKYLRGERKRLMVRLVSTIQLYEKGQEHAKGMRREMEVLNNQILFLLYQKLGNPTQILKLNEEIKLSDNCLEFNVRNIKRNKLVTPFFDLSPHQYVELGLDEFHAGEFMKLTRKIRAYEIMGDCCHELGLNTMGIKHMINAAFLCRRLHVAIEEKENRLREKRMNTGNNNNNRKKMLGFNLEARKGFRFLGKASQFANNPVLISSSGKKMEVVQDDDSGEGDSDELKSMKRFLWGHLLRCVMEYEEGVSDLIQEEREKWLGEETKRLKSRFSYFHQIKSNEKHRGEYLDIVKKARNENAYGGDSASEEESEEDDEEEDEDEDDMGSEEEEEEEEIEGSFVVVNNKNSSFLKSTSKGKFLQDTVQNFGMSSLDTSIDPTSALKSQVRKKRIRRRNRIKKMKKKRRKKMKPYHRQLTGPFLDQRGSHKDFKHLTYVMKESHEKLEEIDDHKDFFFDLKELHDSKLDILIKKKRKKKLSGKQKQKGGGLEGQDDDLKNKKKEKKGREDGEDSDDSVKMYSSDESTEELESEGEEEVLSHHTEVSFFGSGSSVAAGSGVGSKIGSQSIIGKGKQLGKGKGRRAGRKEKNTKGRQGRNKRKRGGGRREDSDEEVIVRRRYVGKTLIPSLQNVHDVRVKFIARLMVIQKGHYVSLFDFLSVLPEDTTIMKFYRQLSMALDREHDENMERWKELKQYTRREDDFAKPSEFLLFKGNQKCDIPECEREYIVKGEDELFSFNCGHVFHGECLLKKLVGTRDLVNIAFMMQKAEGTEDEEHIPKSYFTEPLMTEISLETVQRFDEDSDGGDGEGDGLAVLVDGDDCGEDENNIVATPLRLSQLELKHVIKRLKDLDTKRDSERGLYKSNDHKMNRVFKRILKRIELKSKKDNIMTSICPLCSISQISDIHMQLYALDELDEWRIPRIQAIPPPDDTSDEEEQQKKKKLKNQKKQQQKEKNIEKEEVEGESEEGKDDNEEEEEEEVKVVEDVPGEEEEEDVIVEEEEEERDDDNQTKGDGKKE